MTPACPLVLCSGQTSLVAAARAQVLPDMCPGTHNSTACGDKLCVARLVWFAQVKYTIGGLSFSTLDMEHGVLRGNAPSPAAIPVLLGQPQLAKPYFPDSDPRKKLVRCLVGWPKSSSPKDFCTHTARWLIPGS